jgi:hypothetical protein
MIMPQIMHQELLDYIVLLERNLSKNGEKKLESHHLFRKNIYMAPDGRFFYITGANEPGRKH